MVRWGLTDASKSPHPSGTGREKIKQLSASFFFLKAHAHQNHPKTKRRKHTQVGSRPPRQPQPHACPRGKAETNATSPVIPRPPRHMCTRISCRRRSIGFASFAPQRETRNENPSGKRQSPEPEREQNPQTEQHESTKALPRSWVADRSEAEI